MLEQVRFDPVVGRGSRIVIMLSDRYTDRDVKAFRANRGNVLAECSRPQAPALARMVQQVQP